DVGDHRAISSDLRIVVIAVQKYLVHQRSDLVMRRLDQAEANILGRKLNSVVVLRDLAGWRDDHDCRRVNELSGARIAPVTKSHGIGKLPDLLLLAGQEVPAITIGPAFQMLVHAGDVDLLLLSCV